MPVLRKNPVTNQWVIIATERAKRPRDYKVERQSLESSFCPFCAGNEDATPREICVYRDAAAQSAKRWNVRVVPNKYPALRVEGSLEMRGDGMYDTMEGIGAHEVIIESPDHVIDFSSLSVSEISTVLWAWRDRIVDLRKDARLKCVMIFKNQGAEAGATLEHVHSQLIALPVVPQRLQEELDGAQRYFEFRERCVFCDMLRQELESGVRIVHENAHVVAFAPFASRFPFEVWILPRRHEPWYEAGTQQIYDATADALRVVIKKLNIALDQPAFNLMLHSAPFVHENVAHYHWHIELIPKLNTVAGFEWASGFHINPTPSETAAQHLRDIEIG
ncbi:MAG: galactose-1-phosphate uridylyltransferase [Bradymonadaceae bacterium]|nr:galactose-1-phosphate uridylyltransferase [Lujinxingiaceae bacterium]